VGRDKDLAELHSQLHQSDRLAITALQGMGGIGKTELALRYAYTHQDQHTYPGGICWLRAKDQNIGTELVAFATDELGLTVPTEMDLPRQAQFCWRHWPGDGAVLIVIDDVSGPDDTTAYQAIQPYLPPTDRRFWVLLTTRLQLGASIRSLQIEVLSTAAALELLASLIGQERVQAEPDTATALCDWLGYLPLGLELVGRFLQRKPDWSLAKLQARLAEQSLAAKALCQAHPDMTANHTSVAAAFELSWQDLTVLEQQLAYVLSLYALAPINWQWIEAWFQESNITKSGAIFHRLSRWLQNRFKQPAPEPEEQDLETARDEGLINRSLLTRTGAGTVQLHQLIRAFFRSKLESVLQPSG
jgi:hypothetical protein